LENYGFYIFNFGKDVIELARKEGLSCVFIIEGMLVTKSYTTFISAEYAKDDVEAVHVTLRYKT
jgi:archaellum component FlaG (FlaF/FlaG flagellin family)